MIAELILTAGAGVTLLAAYRIFRPAGGKENALTGALRAAGLPVTDTERAIGRGRVYESKGSLMTPRERRFLALLSERTDERLWRLCPQVRLADVVQVSPRIRERSRTWWRYFGVIAQWHCDVVVVCRESGRIAAVVELDDASHLKARRRRRDAVFEAVLLQAGIPLLRHRDTGRLAQEVAAHLVSPGVLQAREAYRDDEG